MPNHDERIPMNRRPSELPGLEHQAHKAGVDIPKNQFIDEIPKELNVTSETSEAVKDDGSGMITSTPWSKEEGSEGIPMPHPQSYVSGTNRRSAPVLGLPKGMTVQEAHILAEKQNAANRSEQ